MARSQPTFLITGPPSAGKSYVTERVLAIDYSVATAKMDRFYSKGLRAAGIEPTREAGIFNIAQEADKVRNGGYPPEVSRLVLDKVRRLVRRHLANASRLGVGAVFEGYTLTFREDVEMIRACAERLAGAPPKMVRVHLTPPLEDWNRNRAIRPRKTAAVETQADERRYQRAIAPPDPVDGVVDLPAASADEVRAIADAWLRRYKWHQGFELGPVSTRGPSTTKDKLAVIEPEDVVGRRAVDLCCATGAVAIMLKIAGAREVAGIELNPKQYCKGLELQKVLARNTDLDPIVALHLGDVREVLPGLGRFDTAVMLGALHYFADYAGMLALVASAVDGAAYIEFNFREGDLDTAGAADGVHAYTRPSGNTIHLSNRRTVERLIGEAMPGFAIEARTPVSAPARKVVFEREIWRMRRRALTPPA